ncbi:PAS domain-containing hybrid sensor histidine kinase/response regulator [Ovoidimarina sediminis]|uniref:PAS domain-containing hybrid sensor histidine kinase/response regulator n=1 Tax=Ovoidimarina sediminis TaxID=3079856 RepID=UPI00292E863E|nr:ATP-binding protein [Rhodophyticola sp. MJ-SS7]
MLLLLGLIRQSVQSERGAKDAKNRLQNVISTSIDGILAVGRDGRILDYNGAAERIFGYTREEAIGQDMAEVIIPDHLRKAHDAGMTRYSQTGEKRVVDKGLVRLEAKRKDGSVFPVEASISSIEADGEEIFISYMRDISKQVYAEQELVDARDKAVAGEKAKAELLAVMSHEMRTPLNGLLGTMELLEDTELAAPQRKYLSAMETSARLLVHHINDVLSISSADAGQLNLVNSEIRPKELLDELIESQRRAIEANGNRIDIVVSDEPELMWADRIRLNQIILNLVGNANKFTRDGQIAVEFEGLPDGSAVEFRVTDTGIGIAEEDQETIFEDFRTLDPSYGRTAEGTGLGLGIPKRLVEAMGGEIGVESEPGEGSLFWIRLPIGTPTSEANPHTMDEGEPVLAPAIGLKILLVEDNKINRLVAREMLEKAGHSVT